jgi:ArsR family transcriptional regulator, arsenate/arsenite/antimonite-responsive transcriptional repressor
MREILGVMKALSDENRLRIVAALDGRELCLCQIVELLGLANSTVSRHMAILSQAGIVRSRKEGRWAFFRMADETGTESQAAVALVMRSLVLDDQIRDDAQRLKEILSIAPEILCRQRNMSPC